MENFKLLKGIEARNRRAAKARGMNFMPEGQGHAWGDAVGGWARATSVTCPEL